MWAGSSSDKSKKSRKFGAVSKLSGGEIRRKYFNFCKKMIDESNFILKRRDLGVVSIVQSSGKSKKSRKFEAV